jgi:hypothetical protein
LAGRGEATQFLPRIDYGARQSTRTNRVPSDLHYHPNGCLTHPLNPKFVKCASCCFAQPEGFLASENLRKGLSSRYAIPSCFWTTACQHSNGFFGGEVYVLKTSVRYLNGPVSSLRPTPASTMPNHSEISPAENPRGAPHFKELYPTCNLLVAYSADRERHFSSVGCHGVSDGVGSALFFPKRGWRVVLLIETRCTCPLESTCFTAILTRKIS